MSGVNLCSLLRAWSSLFAVGTLLLSFNSYGQSKTIKLRNEIITTESPIRDNTKPRSLAAQAPSSGLFLVQFEARPDAEATDNLRALGVKLLKYVPDDAFIVEFKNTQADSVRALNSVRWVGPFRPDYKLHPKLSAARALTGQSNQLVTVTAQLAPGATPEDLAGVKALFSSIVHETTLRQGTFLRGPLLPSSLDALTQSATVMWVEPASHRRLVDEAASKLVGGDDGQIATPTLTQQLGFDGTGVIVCVADTGLDSGDTNTMHPDLQGRVTGFRYYGSLTDGSDGYGHGTHAAGIVAGNAATGETDADTGALYGLGIASGASLFIERIFDDNAGEADPFPSDADLTRDAVRNGAHIGSNSWGNDVQGDYDTDAAQFDELVRDADPSTPGDQPYILEFSAGNAGPDSETLDSPATGKNVIATGASENIPGTLAMTYGLYADGPDTMADFSSRGPCKDGRIKPDIVAPGTWIASLASSSAPNEAAVSWSPIDDYYVYMGGTSMSGPHAAGAAAIFVQYYKSLHTNAMPSPALVKAALINSATELDQANGGPGPIPNSDEGWGRVDLPKLVYTNANSAPRFYEYVDQSVLLTNNQVYTHHTFVRSADEPLKITLAYTDVPGFPGAIPALVNDLDLEVVGPDGTTYRGNQFSASESVPNSPLHDSLNNVEGVHLANPVPGDYLIRVRGSRVVQDARLDTASVDQDFALVISGDLARPGAGLILLDRSRYTAPSAINLVVLDPGRARSNSVNVLLKSTTEPAGETLKLQASGNYGAFTGAVATVSGAAASDGKLQIHSGDSIEADYVDVSGNQRSANAVADLVAPSLTAVSASSDLGVITITWNTSEPANSTVWFGTNQPPSFSVTDGALVTSHSLRLARLVPGKTYFFFVASADEAGNSTTNNNSGAWFTFVALPTPTVLMVDAYDSAGEADAGSTVIDDGVYTNALAAAGFSYAFWKVTERGSPQLSDLQPFPVVIWRTTDDIVNYQEFPDDIFGSGGVVNATNNTLTAQQQSMITSYLNGGGAFLMASMGILTQLGDVPFRRDVLHVAGFKQNPDPPSPCADCDEYYGVPAVVGAPGDPITSGMAVTLDYGNYPSLNLDFELGDPMVYGPDFADTFTPATNATPILFESVSGKPCGMSYPRVGDDSPGRVVFLSFPLDTVPFAGASPNNEVVLLRNILNFLTPGANGRGTVMLDQPLYTAPDRVMVEVGDSDLAGLGQTQVAFTSSSAANPVNVTLNETTHPGLFRGYVAVATSLTPGVTNQLIVKSGDTIFAKYFDDSNHSNVVAQAKVDTAAAAISHVESTTRYGDAIVRWLTSKPTDALVQYGQSVLLDRTAYAGLLTTNHQVTVTGLLANHDYFYQVVSRDQAGNTTVDDNHGLLYTFTTRAAPRPPWSDNLESGASDWTVVADPSGSDMNWQLGTPNNGLQTHAHSGTNAWGSDLRGEQFNFIASSLLVSPIIDLSGFSQATLNFWSCFDFSAGSSGFALEQGQVMISTNSSATGAELTKLPAVPGGDFSGLSALDWEEQTLDLTPYVGQTIQVVWYYVGVTIGDPVRGWLVDDVAITGVSAGEVGTLVIKKSLGQGTYTVTGPIRRTGTEPLVIITNAFPGDYSIEFSDVAFYQTPAPQSGSITNAGGILTFNGDYTFVDMNRNGISDAWERYFFGTVSTNRLPTTDTDGDGLSDYSEFMAGTNPTNASSKLVFLSSEIQTNHSVQLKWAAIPGRVYQVQSSTDLSTWNAVSDWLQAVTSPSSFTTTNASADRFYRVQVRP